MNLRTKNRLEMKEIYFVMKRRFVLLLATIVALTAMGTTSIWAQEPLGVTVAGVEVTSANAADFTNPIQTLSELNDFII